MRYLAIQSLAFLISTTATPLNITTPTLTFASNEDIGHQCTGAQTWVADGFDRHDCYVAVDLLWREALQRKSQEYEFISPKATAKTDLPKFRTPHRYLFDTCVVIIAMLDQFQPRELPGSDFRERYEDTDVGLFQSIWDAALKVDFRCGHDGKAGWVAMGKSS